MRHRNARLWGGVVCAALAWACFQLMDVTAMHSLEQDAAQYAGYVLVAAALFLLYKGFNIPK